MVEPACLAKKWNIITVPLFTHKDLKSERVWIARGLKL